MNRSDLPAFGAPLEGGFFTDIIILAGRAHALITAPKSCEFKAKLRDAAHADDYVDGHANTVARAGAGCKASKSVLAMTEGGFTDWAIPACDQQECQYFRFKPAANENYCFWRSGVNASVVPVRYPYKPDSPGQTTVAAFQEGGEQAFEKRYYLSSTRYSSYIAVVQDFDGGFQNGHGVQVEHLVRPVRMVPLDD